MRPAGLEIAVGPVFHTLNRGEVCTRLEALDARVVGQVGERTDLLVQGGFGQTPRTRRQARTAQKNRHRAEQLGLPVWNEYALAARRVTSIRGSSPRSCPAAE